MNSISEIIIPLMRRAGKIMLGAEDIESQDNIKEKGNAANLVTVYDVAVQNFLLGEIAKAIPEAVFIAEEKENDPSVLNGKYCFVVDPIDGTSNFAHGYRHSCISLALFSYGEAVFSAIYNPYQDEMFSAIKGGGAFVNGKKMSVGNRDFSHSIAAFGTSPYYKEEHGERTFKLATELYKQCSDVRRLGSAALDMAYLASGRNDLFFECLLSPWDFAAGYLLIKEAGGIVTDMEGNELTFTAPSSVMAASPSVYNQFLEFVKSI